MSNTATLHPKYSGLAFLPNGESVTTKEALERGFKIEGAQSVSLSVAKPISMPSHVAHHMRPNCGRFQKPSRGHRLLQPWPPITTSTLCRYRQRHHSCGDCRPKETTT